MSLSRRRVLVGLGGAFVAGAAAEERRGIIDVHHHHAPPEYVAALAARQIALPKPLLEWSPARSIEDMDRAGVATAIASVTTPGVWFGEPEFARKLARLVNEHAARMAADHPGRFGVFAALPLPDVEGSLAEIEYAFGTLKADGVGLMTSYGGKWLGDAAFAPVFAELNRRQAVVYTHPVSPECCTRLIKEVPDSVVEYGADTTRAIASLVFGGGSRAYPDVKVIFSHAGGTMPFLIERFEQQAKQGAVAARLPQGMRFELGRFFYDTAQTSNPVAMGALRQVVAADHILFGTDYPFRTAGDHVAGLGGCGFSAAELQGIDRANALALLPRLKA